MNLKKNQSFKVNNFYIELLVSVFLADPEYKLKSANQTPTVLNNALSNKNEIIGRNCDDNRQGYTTGVS